MMAKVPTDHFPLIIVVPRIKQNSNVQGFHFNIKAFKMANTNWYSREALTSNLAPFIVIPQGGTMAQETSPF